VNDIVSKIRELSDAALGRTSAQPTLAPRVNREQLDADLDVLAHHANVDEMPTPAGSLPALKRAVLRAGAFNWSRQRAVNVSTRNAFCFILAELDELRASITQNDRRATAALASAESEIDEIRRSSPSAEEHRALDRRVGVLHQHVDDVTTWSTDLHSTVQQLSADVASLKAGQLAIQTGLNTEVRHTSALRTELARFRLGDTAMAFDQPTPLSNDVAELYARFEASFRPSDTELEQRFEDYLDILGELRESVHPLVDLGAGRGEFVAVLVAHGIPARGIDFSADAVEEAQQNGRPVEFAEAVAYLSKLESESLAAVTAFHLIEHLEPEVVLHLLDESLRVLRPGGLLIVETPNPTNLNVGAAAFYHDPTHLRPVTPTYLEFLVRDRGFTDVATRFLHPLPEFGLELTVKDGGFDGATKMLLQDLRWALKGPQDYAVLARRAPRP
jgi:O-antigen chain-terminating methyltransferase